MLDLDFDVVTLLTIFFHFFNTLMNTVREVRWIRMDFVVPPQTLHFHQKPCSYLSHLIGHEGPGSILACLKSENLANDLSAGLNTNLDCFGLFRISVDCTEKGITQVEKIVEIVFSYLQMLRNSSITKGDEGSEGKKLVDFSPYIFFALYFFHSTTF